MGNSQVERLKRLGQRKEETWQGGLGRLGWVREKESKPLRLWAALWVPDHLPEGYQLGDETEAVVCVSGLRAAWKAVPGAVE